MWICRCRLSATDIVHWLCTACKLCGQLGLIILLLLFRRLFKMSAPSTDDWSWIGCLPLVASTLKFGCNRPSKLSKKKKMYIILHFPPNLTSDDPWPCYMTFDLITIQRNHHCIFDPRLVPIRLPTFQRIPNNKKITFSIFHLTWPQVTLDLGTWPLTSLTYEIRLFKGDPNNGNPTKLEHTYIQMEIQPNWSIHTDLLSQYALSLFKPGW